MRLFGFDVDASTLPPWIVAVAAVRRRASPWSCWLWPRVGDAWGAVNARLHLRGQA